MRRGKQTLVFRQKPYIIDTASVVGKKESEGPLGMYFDKVDVTNLFDKKTWEEAEAEMQRQACVLTLEKAGVNKEQVHHLFGGDLLRQGIATTMGIAELEIPLMGLFGACSTSGEALALGAMSVAAGYGDYVLAVTSSHFATAEKEFRFPLGYANQRAKASSWTVTGSAAFLVGKQQTHVRINGTTIGKIVDYGMTDSQNMGACMAPAACDTIFQHLTDVQNSPAAYDKIVTGDLGHIGSEILIDLLKEKGIDISKQHMDCGVEIFDQATQNTNAGGSGCGCAATTLSAYILPQIANGTWKKVLFVPTGALMSTVSYNEGMTVPGIAHGVVLEHC